MRSAFTRHFKSLLQLAIHTQRAHLSAATALEQRNEFTAYRRQAKQRQSVVEQTQYGGISRRDFLKLSGSAAIAGGALWTTRGLKAHAADRRVLIVGAGTAGLTCAYRLQQAGLSPVIVEASNRVGGRMFSRAALSDPKITVENGGEFVDTGHEALRNLVTELGLDLDDIAAAGKGLDEDLYYFDGKYISDQQILEMLSPIAAGLATDVEMLYESGIDYSTPKESKLVAIDQLSAMDYIDRYELDPVARKIIDVTFTTEFGGDASDLSAINLLWLLSLESKDDFYPYGTSDEAYHIRQGSGSVPTKLASLLKQPVQTGTALEAIKPNGSGFTVTVNQGGTVKDLVCDDLVVAIPFSTLRDVQIDVELPPLKLKAIRDLRYGTNTKNMLEFKSRLWETGDLKSTGDSFSDLSYQNSWSSSTAQPGTTGVLTIYNGGTQGLVTVNKPLAEATAIYVDEVDMVYPGLKAQFLTSGRMDWPNYRWTKGSYAYYRPGDYSTFGTVEAKPVGRLFFSGEHTSLISAGYMNGAVDSGERAAQEVLGTA